MRPHGRASLRARERGRAGQAERRRDLASRRERPALGRHVGIGHHGVGDALVGKRLGQAERPDHLRERGVGAPHPVVGLRKLVNRVRIAGVRGHVAAELERHLLAERGAELDDGAALLRRGAHRARSTAAADVTELDGNRRQPETLGQREVRTLTVGDTPDGEPAVGGVDEVRLGPAQVERIAERAPGAGEAEPVRVALALGLRAAGVGSVLASRRLEQQAERRGRPDAAEDAVQLSLTARRVETRFVHGLQPDGADLNRLHGGGGFEGGGRDLLIRPEAPCRHPDRLVARGVVDRGHRAGRGKDRLAAAARHPGGHQLGALHELGRRIAHGELLLIAPFLSAEVGEPVAALLDGPVGRLEVVADGHVPGCLRRQRAV